MIDIDKLAQHLTAVGFVVSKPAGKPPVLVVRRHGEEGSMVVLADAWPSIDNIVSNVLAMWRSGCDA